MTEPVGQNGMQRLVRKAGVWIAGVSVWLAGATARAQELGAQLPGEDVAGGAVAPSQGGPYYGGLNIIGWAVTVGALLLGWLLAWILFFLFWRQLRKSPHDAVRWAYGLTALALVLGFCFGIWPTFGYTHALPNLLGWVVAGILFLLVAILLVVTRRTA